MEFTFPDRQSIRMPGYDYRTPAGYFISLVAMDRLPRFGRIVRHRVELSPEGKIVAAEWIRTPAILSEITLDEWIVMPDHFQAIVWINGIVRAGVGLLSAGIHKGMPVLAGLVPARPKEFIERIEA